MLILRKNGITVEFYDKKYEKQIAEANRDFFKEATERAKIINENSIVPSINPIEDPNLDFQLEDLSEEAQIDMIQRMNLPYNLGSDSFKSFLAKMKLIHIDNETKIASPTGLGLLLLGKNPEHPFPQSRIKFTIKRKNQDPIIKDFKGPLVLLPNKIEDYLELLFPKGFSRKSFSRTEDVEVSYTAILEVIMNAIIHRSYEIEGARIMIEVNEDKILVLSPGIPLVPISKLNGFSAPSFSRNPKISHIFFDMGYVEERGFGMEELSKLNKTYGLPKPIFELDGNILKTTIFRNYLQEFQQLAPLPKGLDILKKETSLSSSRYAELAGVSKKTARNHLNNLVFKGYAKKIDKGRSTKFVLSENSIISE